jgi:hypothetical protein
MLTRIVIVLVLSITLSSFAFSQQKVADEEANIKELIADLHKNQWNGAEIVGESPTTWDFGFTKPMREILKIGSPAQEILLPYLKNEFIKDQVMVLLGGVGDERAVSPIIDAMIAEKDIEAVPKAKQINRAANLALSNITVADVIWHHGGGIVIERCPNNPKECWLKWWKKNKSTFSVKGITQSRYYSNYPNYGIYRTQGYYREQ